MLGWLAISSYGVCGSNVPVKAEVSHFQRRAPNAFGSDAGERTCIGAIVVRGVGRVVAAQRGMAR